jgi:hypothetical protein
MCPNTFLQGNLWYNSTALWKNYLLRKYGLKEGNFILYYICKTKKIKEDPRTLA